MTGITNLVRKLKQAVTGVEEPAPTAQPFHWEPAPAAPPPGPRSLEPPPPVTAREELPTEPPPAPPAVPAAPAAPRSSAAPQWKRLAPPSASVVGAEIPADVSDFAAVYRGAGVEEPSHGYGVDRVAQMLDHKSLAGLDKSVKASAVLAALDAAGVHVHDVVHDGLLRYKALVAFEAAKELEFHAVGPRNEHRVEQLRLAIASFQQKKNAELQALTQEATAAVAALSRLKARQRAEEERFHRAISLLVEPLPARVLPMTPKAEAGPAEQPGVRTELKLVVDAMPASEPPAPDEPPAPAEPTAATGTAGRTPSPDASEQESLSTDSHEARLPSERPTIKLTPEQMSLIAEAEPDAHDAGLARREPESEPPAPQAAPHGSKDPTVRLTAQQAAEIVAGFKDMAAETAGGETGAASQAGVTSQDSPVAIVQLTSEQVAELGGASPAPEPDRPADEPALPLDSTALKDRVIRLTAAQTRAILARFAAQAANGERGSQDGERAEAEGGSPGPSERRDGGEGQS